MKRTKRIWALMLTLLMTLCLLPGAAFAEGEEYYWHSKSTEENTKTYYQRSVHRICEGGYIPAIYNIVDGGGEQHNVYCCDYEVNILKTGDKIEKSVVYSSYDHIRNESQTLGQQHLCNS